MNPIYLLDTNVCIQILRARDPSLFRRVQSHPPYEICLCSVVVGELYYGAFRAGATYQGQNLTTLAKFLPTFQSLPYDGPAAERFGRIKTDLAARGRMIGPHDLQIAAIALVHSLILVTHNTREFSQVAGLSLEDWQTIP